MKGTKNRNHEQISRELEQLGLTIGVASNEDYFQVTGAAVKEDLPKLLFMLEDILANPTFPQAEMDKERRDMLENIKTSRDQASSLMFEKLTRALYANHPYGAIGDLVEASLPSLTREDLIGFYQAEMQPQNLVISVVGNFNPEMVKTAFQQILSELPATEKAAKPKLPEAPAGASGHLAGLRLARARHLALQGLCLPQSHQCPAGLRPQLPVVRKPAGKTRPGLPGQLHVSQCAPKGPLRHVHRHGPGQ
jgi:predicted Zn-dependent peptidase